MDEQGGYEEKKHGCFFYGCLTALGIVVLFIAVLAGIYYYGRSTITPYVDSYTDAVDAGEYEKAIADCDKILKLGLNSPWVHYHRGMAHFEMGDYMSAITDFKNAKNISTDSTFDQMIDQNIETIENLLNKTNQ